MSCEKREKTHLWRRIISYPFILTGIIVIFYSFIVSLFVRGLILPVRIFMLFSAYFGNPDEKRDFLEEAKLAWNIKTGEIIEWWLD